jgi:hypothetical protein
VRTISTAQERQLTRGHYKVSAKVEIDRTGSGSWVDITSLQSRNWVKEITIDDSVDAPTATATLMIDKKQYYYNLSPLMSTSLLNSGGVLVTLFRKVRISVAMMPINVPAAAGDYVYVFKGRINAVDWSGDEIKVECRDHGGELMDCFIETHSLTYGSSAGVLAETVMQQILTAQVALLPAAVTLYSITGTGGTPFQGADSPGWAIRAYKQDMMPTFAALQVLAQQIGWVLKYRYNSSVGDYVLTWYDPVRSNTTSLRTFTASQYSAITECSLHLGDIRNYARVFYKDTSGNVQSVTASDSTSITNYGRKYMQIAEEATSQINTSTEAQKMVDGCVSDLALPTMTHTVEMPFFWPVEPGDIYTFSANNVHYDTDQKLSVFGYRHSLVGNKSSTSLTLRGKPSGGVCTWFEREASIPRKQFGVENLQVTVDEANQCPNGTFVQYSRG